MIRCWFGHKIENDVCIRCGKTVCEIKGHEWIYSDYTDVKLNGNTQRTAILRRCINCKQIEKVSEIHVWNKKSINILSKDWERVA